MTTPDHPRTVVLVHGGWHGPWTWAPVAAWLAADGHRPILAALPSSGLNVNRIRGITLLDDAALVRDTIRAVRRQYDTPVTVVGWSYGGAVVAQALRIIARGDVDQVRYIAAAVPPLGVAPIVQLNHPDSRLTPHMSVSTNGVASLQPEAADVLYSGLYEHDRGGHAATLTRMSIAAPMSPLHGDDPRRDRSERHIRSLPTRYLVVADDVVLPADAQRAIAGGIDGDDVRVTEFASGGHAVHLAQPAAVASWIVAADAVTDADSAPDIEAVDG